MQYCIIKDNTMDPTKEAINLDELELDIGQLDATGAVTGTFGYDFSNMTSSITMPSSLDTITLSSSPYSTTASVSVIGALGNTFPYANTTASQPWYTTSSPYIGNGITGNPSEAGKLTLNGENADIEVNGQSLLGMIRRIEERLNILTPNPKMEEEWDQLKELGDQYRALEAKLKEQGDMWAKLKAMPPPEIA
jgi:hypothetical protein